MPQPAANGWNLAWPLIIGSVRMMNTVSAVTLITTSTALTRALLRADDQ